MKVSELIEELQKAKDEHGDLWVLVCADDDMGVTGGDMTNQEYKGWANMFVRCAPYGEGQPKDIKWIHISAGMI